MPATEKPRVFREIYRLLKPHGGRVAISDILARSSDKKMPDDVQNDAALYASCISGASAVAEYERWIREAGFNGA